MEETSSDDNGGECKWWTDRVLLHWRRPYQEVVGGFSEIND